MTEKDIWTAAYLAHINQGCGADYSAERAEKAVAKYLERWPLDPTAEAEATMPPDDFAHLTPPADFEIGGGEQ